MKLLMTGAFNCTAEQKVNIENLGCEIMFHQMENEPLSEEMFTAEAVICNGLFLHNDIEKFPNLRFIQLTSAGLDRVPVEKINEKSIILASSVRARVLLCVFYRFFDCTYHVESLFWKIIVFTFDNFFKASNCIF